MKALQLRRRAPGMPVVKLLFFWTIVQVLLRLLYGVLYRLHLEGAENVPLRGGVLYVSNHQTHFDPVLGGILVADRPPGYLARSTLFRSRLFAMLIRMLNAIPLHRDKGGLGALRAAIDELNAGRCVLMFPEGTRTGDGALGRFQGGFALLAKKTGAPIVPIAVEGAYDVWPRHRKGPRLRGRIALKAGPALDPENLLADGPDVAVETVKRLIETMRLELRATMRRRTRDRLPAPGPGVLPDWADLPGPSSSPSPAG